MLNLNLASVQVHGDHMVGSSGGEQIRHKSDSDDDGHHYDGDASRGGGYDNDGGVGAGGDPNDYGGCDTDDHTWP